MLLKIQSKEDKEHFLLLHPHYTAESALHEQFLANFKTPNGYTNIKNALLISLAALNEFKQDNTFASSPIVTTDTTTPMAIPKVPYKSLTDPPNDIHNSGMKIGNKIGMNEVDSLPTSPPSLIAPAFSPITTTNNNNIPINSTVQVQDITPVNNSITYTSPEPTLNMLTFYEPNHFATSDTLQVEYKTFMEKHMDEQVILIHCNTRKSHEINHRWITPMSYLETNNICNQ